MTARYEIPPRYELKYLISERVAAQVRAGLSPFCELDAHSARAPDRQYVIRSLYLDTPGHRLYRASREGLASRFKVRIRQYAAAGPTFLEIKSKAGAVVRKTRASVGGDFLPHVVGPLLPDAPPNERAFRARVDGLGLAPALLVRYEREAWASVVDRYARVTFDRRIACQPARGYDLGGDAGAWLPLDDRDTMGAGAVLLELKSALDVPRWMASLAERLELRRTGFSKYCNGLERCAGRAALVEELGAVSRWA